MRDCRVCGGGGRGRSAEGIRQKGEGVWRWVGRRHDPVSGCPMSAVEKPAGPFPAVEKPAVPFPAVEKPAGPFPAVERLSVSSAAACSASPPLARKGGTSKGRPGLMLRAWDGTMRGVSEAGPPPRCLRSGRITSARLRPRCGLGEPRRSNPSQIPGLCPCLSMVLGRKALGDVTRGDS